MSIIKGLHASLIAQQVKEVMKKKGYAFFESGAFNANIVGIRASEKKTNVFDDTMLLIYKNKKKEWEVISSVITTDPGEKYLVNPINDKGTAILVPNQYRGVYRVDIHARNNSRFAHEALCQRGGKLKVWRDNDRDKVLDHDPESIDEGWFGVNIHRSKSSGEADYVGSYSAGCQVYKNSTDFKLFMDVVKRSAKLYGNSFSYTLLDEQDFED
tara:strand:+ start:28127 stop:28765 length:639 start_codon:yes stop_codon:yes gene_type:complete